MAKRARAKRKSKKKVAAPKRIPCNDRGPLCPTECKGLDADGKCRWAALLSKAYWG